MKELDVRFSRSYGPGRYDSTYEERGIDYPIGYVRWTERRNLASFLDLIADKKVSVEPSFPRSSLREAEQSTSRWLRKAAGNVIGAVRVRQDAVAECRGKVRSRRRVPPRQAMLRLAVIGAGNYASSMLLPHLQQR